VVEGQKKDGTIFPIRLAISELVVGEETFYCGLVEELEVPPHGSRASTRPGPPRMLIVGQILCAGSIVPYHDQRQGDHPLRQREGGATVRLQEGSAPRPWSRVRPSTVDCRSVTHFPPLSVQTEMLGQNISVLVDEAYADKHDSFIQRYIHGGGKTSTPSTRCSLYPI